MKDITETKDLFLAALWLAKGRRLQGVRREGTQCWFKFSDKKACEEMQFRLYSREETVNAKDYMEAIRTLKDLIYSN